MKKIVAVLALCLLLLGGCSGQEPALTSSAVLESNISSITGPESSALPEESEAASSQAAPAGESSQAAPSSSQAAASRQESSRASSAPEPAPQVDNSGPAAACAITYGRDQLSESEQDLYDRMYYTIYHLQTVMNGFSPVSQQTMQKVYLYLRADHPEIFWFPARYTWQYSDWLGENNVYAVAFQYVKCDENNNPTQEEFTRDEVNAMREELEQAVSAAINGITAGQSDFDKVKNIHDYLIKNTDYQTSANCSNLYGALVEGTATCEGYSEAFQYLLSRVGLESLTVRGVAGAAQELHQWNLVKMDGDYYHIDPTFDDPVIQGKSDNYVSYQYFGLTDEAIASTHTANGENYPLPDCTATRNNYYVHRGLLFSDFDEAAYQALVEEAARVARAGEASVSVQFASESAYQKAYDALITGQGIAAVWNATGVSSFDHSTYYLYGDGEQNILDIGISYS